MFVCCFFWRYACPDLTNKEGNWAKALTERYCGQGNFIHFYVMSNGEMHYGVNGVNKGVFFNGINVSLPMWVLLDIYGNSTCVEFVGKLLKTLLKHNKNRTLSWNIIKTENFYWNIIKAELIYDVFFQTRRTFQLYDRRESMKTDRALRILLTK